MSDFDLRIEVFVDAKFRANLHRRALFWLHAQRLLAMEKAGGDVRTRFRPGSVLFERVG